VSLEAVPRENEEGAGRDDLAADGRGVLCAVEGRGAEVVVTGVAVLTGPGALAGVPIFAVEGVLVAATDLGVSCEGFDSDGVDFDIGLTACGILLEPETVRVLCEDVEVGCLTPGAAGILLGVGALTAFGL
jgi:hypothetical protein